MTCRSAAITFITAGIVVISSAISSTADGLVNQISESSCIQDGGTEECKNDGDFRSSNTGIDRATNTSSQEQNIGGFQCGIYLATSSIPNAGFGIYTTRSIAEFEPIQPYPESPSIAVTDFYEVFNNKEEDWGHSNYYWDGTGVAAFEGDEVYESVMTYGSLCNYHPILKSLFPSNTEYDDTLLNRSENPGAGAISYHGRHFVATRDIEAGEELFDDYGDHWLDNRPGTYADKVPRREDYEQAAVALSRMNKENKRFDDAQLSMIAETLSVFNERAASVFPDTTVKHKRFIKMTNEYLKRKGIEKINKRDLAYHLARSSLEKRDIDWIKNNGLCLEKIRPGLSTIPEAGRGAFAQMFIRAGDIISPVPLLTIPDKDSLLMYRSEINSEGERVMVDEDDDAEPIGHQLLLNYCFGHTESQLILCPQTNAILINHCSMRQKHNRCNNGNGPNAKVQWANKWDPTNEEWLQKSTEEIKELVADGQRGLSLEIVATTDIVPGEEIFIDYGEHWEDAWNAHVKNWSMKQAPNENRSSNSTTTYTPLKKMFDRKDYRTMKELKTNPYPEHVQLFCYGGRLIESKGNLVNKNGVSNEGKVVTIDGSDGGFDSSYDDLNEPDFLFPCDIHERDNRNRSASDNRSTSKSSGSGQWKVQIHFDERSVIVKNYPRDSVKMTIQKYTSDMHMEGVFRHFIEIEDDIFPSHWKDNAEDSEE